MIETRLAFTVVATIVIFARRIGAAVVLAFVRAFVHVSAGGAVMSVTCILAFVCAFVVEANGYCDWGHHGWVLVRAQIGGEGTQAG